MYFLINNTPITYFLNTKMNKYEISSPNKTISKLYKGSTKENENFKITVYNTGSITIEGTLKEKIYTTLFLLTEEINYAGYDEVGVGDFFGPTVYVSCLLTQDTINKLSNKYLPIKDSKKLKDFEILKIYDDIKDIVEHKVQIVFDKDINNLNSIAQKSYYHYQNIFEESSQNVVDLFTTVKSFHKYEEQLNIKYPSNTILETKADSKFICVALASIFARAYFLQEIAKLEEKYQMVFQLGANNVKEPARMFIQRYGKDELATFCKTSFKTFNEL